MARFDLHINGSRRSVQADADSPLLYVLRDQLELHGPKFGCGLGQCGACTVHIDGQAVRSCSYPVSAVGKRPVTTLEGLASGSKPSALQQAFIDEQAVQCGYCINGMVMQAADLLKRTPKPTEAQIREGLSMNLCRCGTHQRIVRAVQRASGQPVTA
jgi:nicotinate dehydrogenase subunit A